MQKSDRSTSKRRQTIQRGSFTIFAFIVSIKQAAGETLFSVARVFFVTIVKCSFSTWKINNEDTINKANKTLLRLSIGFVLIN